jgi:hypothetical protein
MSFSKRMIRLRRSLGHILGLAVMVLLLAGPACAQTATGTQEVAATPELRAAIVDSVTAALNRDYVFEDVAKKMEKQLKNRLRKGDYDDLATVADLARVLTDDLQKVSGDRHLGVRYASDEAMAMLLAEEDDPELAHARAMEELRRSNFQFRKCEVMDGNVGYLRLDGFTDASFAGPTATAAMNFLGNADALIVDLRYNGGGSPSLIQYLLGYLLEEPTHINSFHTRQGDSVHQFWSAPYVPGPSMKDVDLYVLTSSYTFSGAEEFTYDVKNLKRGTIVGETTGGGAHPVDYQLFPTLHCGLRVPYARAVNPISGTNWEGTGVTPDIEVPSDQALDRAYMEALSRLATGEQDEARRFQLQWAIDGLRVKLEPVTVDEATLRSYAGQYGPRKLWVENGTLMYQREDAPAHPAFPLTAAMFGFPDIDYFRLEVVLDDTGTPVGLVGHYGDGRTDENPRTGD